MVPWAHLLCLYLRFGADVFVTMWFPDQRGRSRHGGRPAFQCPSLDAVGLKMGAGEGEGPGGAAAARLRCSSRAQATGRKVLVKLMHVKPVHGADDVGTELRNVHMAEVNVLAIRRGRRAAAAIWVVLAIVFVCHMNFSVRGRGRCWRSVRMAWTKKSQ